MLLGIHHKYSWPALSQRTERKTEQNKTLLIVRSKYSVLSKFAEGSVISPKSIFQQVDEKTGKRVFLYKPILLKRHDIPELLRCNNVMQKLLYT